MKKPRYSTRAARHKKIACTVSAAALMLGVSSGATIGLHFQENYCNGSGLPAGGYSGFPVTLTAFGIQPSSWENLLPMDTGYAGCSGPLGYTLSEVIDTTTSTNGLNPLPNGSLSVTWFGPTANFSGFGGYAGNPPNYNYGGAYPNGNTQPTGEEQIYATFLRDGVNFGPGSSGADNNQPAYSVDITGLKSVFTNTPFVVELMASSDSMQLLTNAFVIDVTNSVTNSVTYPNTPPVANAGGAPWIRGSGGGLSTFTGALNTDHIKITSNQPQHGGSGGPPTGFDNAGTISGFIITDKPVVSMSPRSLLGGPGDSIVLSAYAIGVPPLSYQWQKNGSAISGATNTSYSIPSVTLSSGGGYALVVTNLYGVATSAVATVTADVLTTTAASNIVSDSNPDNPQHNGVNAGATWQATNSDGTITRTGVMQFVAAKTNSISVQTTTNFDGGAGTITFWMRSAGTDTTTGGGTGASIFSVNTGNTKGTSDFVLIQLDGGFGNMQFQSPGNANLFDTSKPVSDNKWHFVAITFDESATGGVGVFVDGALDTTNVNASAWSIPTGQPLVLGSPTDPSFRPYDGFLSDVRFYSAVLTPVQIASVQSGALADTNDLQLRLNFSAAPGSGLILNWLEPTGILQSAPNVEGPYKDVPGIVAPYTIVPGAGQEFFRYRYVPQALVSNPYLM